MKPLFFVSLLLILNLVKAQTKFTDVTKEAGIDHIFDVYQGLFGGGVAVFDYNNDGYEDLFLTSGQGKDILYKNNGDGKFSDVTKEAGLVQDLLTVTTGVSTADINKDGTEDLYGFREDWFNPWIDCKKQVSAMYLNQNNKSFKQISKSFNQENFGLYGCERASNFFKNNNNYYRLFITLPSTDSKFAYLGIEKY